MQIGRWSVPILTFAFAFAFAAAHGTPAQAGPITFIQDDFERARAESTARKLPLFVEVWAPW